MRKRKYRIRPAPNTENEWLAEYSYLGLFWCSVVCTYSLCDLGGYGETYTTKAEAKAVIDEDIRSRLAIRWHQINGSERYR